MNGIIEYRCKRCSDVIEGAESKHPGFTIRDAVSDGPAERSRQGVRLTLETVDAPAYLVHECPDGGLGYAELIGARVIERGKRLCDEDELVYMAY